MKALLCALVLFRTLGLLAAEPQTGIVDATSLRAKVMCGYQGWFRCPGDAAESGWVHWSRDSRRITPESLTFEMWPDMSEYSAAERFVVPGFTYSDGRPAHLFSSENAATVLRHFEWMRDYGIDGAWLQHFVIDLPGAPGESHYPSRRRVIEHVRQAAAKTGRVWALTYDLSGMPGEKTFEVLTSDWDRMVKAGVTADPRYLHHEGKPVVEIFGFYAKTPQSGMSAELGNKLLDFFAAPGSNVAFVVGGGDWNWRRTSDPEWEKLYHRLGAYIPWNIGNFQTTATGEKQATTGYWEADKRDCEGRGKLWIPSVYPGFSWENLQHQPSGAGTISRRGGRFLWEQFHALSKLGVDSVFVAMFDEVDEGTAIFKVTSSPPTQAHFVGFDGLPSDWYLRLLRESATRLRRKIPIPAEIPIQP